MRRARTWLPGLLLVAPSIVAIGVFVYGMLGWNFQLAMTDKHDEVTEGEFVGLTNFVDIWDEAWPEETKRNLIRESKIHQIDNIIATSQEEGMITMDNSLIKLFREGKISKENAIIYSSNGELMEKKLARL